jgi:endo-beta-N-acetylglucosaminidase D
MGPISLPFTTSFCLGSGKKNFRLGNGQENSQWFNLAKQHFQPSIPMSSYTEQVMNHYEASLNGGSCLKIKAEDLRLFVCDISMHEDLLLCYAIQKSKKDVEFGVTFKVVGHDMMKIVCGEERDDTGKESQCKMLTKDEIIKVVGYLGSQLRIPGFPVINKWEIRYYYISVKNVKSPAKISDIGVEMKNANPEDHILLGGLSVHQGSPNLRAMLTNINEPLI